MSHHNRWFDTQREASGIMRKGAVDAAAVGMLVMGFVAHDPLANL